MSIYAIISSQSRIICLILCSTPKEVLLDLNDAVIMITYVAQVINLLATTVQNVFFIASFIGELIISALLWSYNVLINTCDHIRSFFNIVYEDNICIFTELPKTFKDILDTTLDQFLYIHNGVEEVSQYVSEKIYAIISTITWLINAVALIISEVCILLTNTLILMGQTLWLLITFIPVHLPLLVKSGTRYISDIIMNTIVNGYMRLLIFTNYLTEVPLESFLGLTSAVIIVRLCVHFRETISTNLYNFYWSLVRNMLYLYYACYNYWTNPEVQIITRMVSGDIMNARDSNLDDVFDDANSASDALCVICQERQKCVLTLPCRHICLCTECCRRLYGYQRTCPICRTFIYHSVSVYW